MSYGWDRGRVKTTPGRPSIRYSDLRASAVVPEQSAPSSRLRWVTARPACRHSSSAVASPWCKTRAMPPLVGFQTGQCCRGHFRKPRVETLTEIHRQPYSITRPLRRALMSAWGHSRRVDRRSATSVLPSISDIVGAARLVRIVPTTDVGKVDGRPQEEAPALPGMHNVIEATSVLRDH